MRDCAFDDLIYQYGFEFSRWVQLANSDHVSIFASHASTHLVTGLGWLLIGGILLALLTSESECAFLMAGCCTYNRS